MPGSHWFAIFLETAKPNKVPLFHAGLRCPSYGSLLHCGSPLGFWFLVADVPLIRGYHNVCLPLHRSALCFRSSIAHEESVAIIRSQTGHYEQPSKSRSEISAFLQSHPRLNNNPLELRRKRQSSSGAFQDSIAVFHNPPLHPLLKFCPPLPPQQHTR